MKRIDLKVGFQCNNACSFCVQGDKRKKCPNKSSAEIKEILRKEAPDHQGVVFTGGEPTIRKGLIDWVKYAKQLGYKVVQIQSNGRLFSYKAFCEKLVIVGANEFSPAIHGSKAKIHDGLTRVHGSFKQVVRGIENLKSLNQYVLTNTVITKTNYKDLPELARLLVSLKVNQFQFAFMHINQIIANDQKLIKEIVPRYLDVEPYVKKGLQIGIDAGIKVMTEAIPYCFMKGYEEYIAEKQIPDTSVFDHDIELADYGLYRKTQGKAKGPNCRKCEHNNTCEGSWKEYPEIFGWEEFVPSSRE